MGSPALIPFDGDWDIYVEKLYAVYLETIVNGNLKFQGLTISCQYRPETQGKHFGFWHVISEGNTEKDRTPDFRRCERIAWIAYLIGNAENDEGIRWWKNKRGQDVHVVIWYEIESFAVILAERNNYYLLKTAYPVKEHRSKSFLKEWAVYHQSNPINK